MGAEVSHSRQRDKPRKVPSCDESGWRPSGRAHFWIDRSLHEDSAQKSTFQGWCAGKMGSTMLASDTKCRASSRGEGSAPLTGMARRVCCEGDS